MRRREIPTKYVGEVAVRVTEEALEGATLLVTRAPGQGIVGLRLTTLGDTPEDADRLARDAAMRLGEALLTEVAEFTGA